MTSPSGLEAFVATKGRAFARDTFGAMVRAVDRKPAFVGHPAAAIGWTRTAGNSPLECLQRDLGSQIYLHSACRRLCGNALRRVSLPDAKALARAQR